MSEFIPLTKSTSSELEAISQARRLSLDLNEMQAIQTYYCHEGREPTDIELETIAQTWSEHCIHKTFKAKITYDMPGPNNTVYRQQIDSLLDTYIKAATYKVDKHYIYSAFIDNAGIVAFDKEFDIAFKCETHNHPSAISPFDGAHTGVGGVVRDILGVSARPIANTDVLCFGPQDTTSLPDGVLHPTDIFEGVIAGIEDYGNKMGIPTVNGAILYDPGYMTNPLVFCGCLGILPRGSHPTMPHAGDMVVVIGGKTGSDGLRGATFSSMEMSRETDSAPIQTGDPIYEKQILEVILAARDEKLYTAINDCGGGGFSSAIGEMASELGAVVHLDRAPLKCPELEAWEIWLSESQERMILAIHKSCWPRFQEICEGLDVEVAALGHFADNGILKLYYKDVLVGQIDNDFLYKGLPQRHLQAIWELPANSEPVLESSVDLTADLLALLRMPNIRSKEDVVRRYDHEVQAGTVVKPFVGSDSSGPGDAAVIKPLGTEGLRGIALSVGINPRYGKIDPYAMAWAVVDEAIRNCVCVGANPDQVSLLDNFCWGNPNDPICLGGLVRCAKGCYDAAVAYGTPFVSGKDSLNNEYIDENGQQYSVTGTLLISAMAIVPDITRTITSDLKEVGNPLYIVGLTRDELGGSAYYQLHEILGANVPQPPTQGFGLFRVLHQAINDSLVLACHDCSEGGLLVAVAEMALGGKLGIEMNLTNVPCSPDVKSNETIAFSESLARFLLEVKIEDALAFETSLADFPIAKVGHVCSGERILVNGLDGNLVIETDLEEINKAWRGCFETKNNDYACNGH